MNIEDTNYFSLIKDCYQSQNFNECKNLLKDKHSLNAQYYFVRGTIEAKLDNFADARYFLELAKENGIGSSVLENNLKLVKYNLKTHYIEKSNLKSKEIINKLANESMDYWIIFCWPLIFLSLFFVYKKFKLFVSLTPSILAAIFLVTIYFVKADLISAVSLTPVDIYDGPSKAFEQIRELPSGIKLIVDDVDKDWFYIKYPDSYAGWIQKEDVKLIFKIK